MTLYRDVVFPARLDDPEGLEGLAPEPKYVIATWSSSYKAAHAAGILPSEDWPLTMHRAIFKHLTRPGARAIVAVERGVIEGFIAGDTSHPLPVVFYVYVGAPFRRSGHTRGLFQALGVDPNERFLYSCTTSIVTRLGHKIRKAKFVPATLRYTNYQEGRFENDH